VTVKVRTIALGIEAASFFEERKKDKAESPARGTSATPLSIINYQLSIKKKRQVTSPTL